MESDEEIIGQVKKYANPFEVSRDLDSLLDLIGNSRYVLLGEASHGTHEYYIWRAELSKRLITEKGFSFIAVEGDWPECYEVNRYVKGYKNSNHSAEDVLKNSFKRWPTWMWANYEILEFVEWIREYNGRIGADSMIGFYGLDVYSLWESLREIINYLQIHDPKYVSAAVQAYTCFEPFGNVEKYARHTAIVPKSCQKEVVDLLVEVLKSVKKYDEDGEDTKFNVEQNAYVVKDAEEYYRTMARGGPDSWNIRDTHMADTLDKLMDFHSNLIGVDGKDARGIVWAHNTHVGDARYSDMVYENMISLGQTVRERHEKDGVVILGFGSYQGWVIAANAWGAPMEEMEVPPAYKESWEEILHRVDKKNKIVFSKDIRKEKEQYPALRGNRAIGVVYDPLFEYGNYVLTDLFGRYDVICFLDKTSALKPIPIDFQEFEQPPETFPSGF